MCSRVPCTSYTLTLITAAVVTSADGTDATVSETSHAASIEQVLVDVGSGDSDTGE